MVRALILSAVGLAVLAGCGSQYAEVEPENPTKVADGLVFTRADGSSYELDEAVATCSRSRVTGTEYVNLVVREDHGARSRFLLEVAAGVTGTRVLPLRDRLWSAMRRNGTGPADLLVLAQDPQDGTRLAGFGRRARGTVTVTEASCDPQPRISVQIDAELATSAGRPVRVEGGLASIS